MVCITENIIVEVKAK